MCLYPQRIRNPRYTPTKRNQFNPPQPPDGRLRWIEVGCGYCYECLKQKANSWKFRLQQEIKNKENKKCLFVTLTYNDESLQELKQVVKEKENHTEMVNGICKVAVKRFRERWRKKYAKSPKHWFVTELGGEYGRIHLHGILFEETDSEELTQLWKYGFVYIGKYVNERTIEYIIKYLYKGSDVDRTYTPIVLTSPGIGKIFFQTYDCQALSPERSTVRLKSGIRMEAPTYYKQRQLSEEQKIQLHRNNLDKGVIWVDGIEYIDEPSQESIINKARREAMERYQRIGYLSEQEILAIKREKRRKKK